MPPRQLTPLHWILALSLAGNVAQFASSFGSDDGEAESIVAESRPRATPTPSRAVAAAAQAPEAPAADAPLGHPDAPSDFVDDPFAATPAPAAAAAPSVAAAPAASPAAAAAPNPEPAPAVAAAPSAAPAPAAAPAPSPAAAPATAPLAAAAASPTAGVSLRVSRASLERSIPHTLASVIPELKDTVAAAFTRLVVWDLDLRRDLRPGDALALVWEGDSAETIVVHAATYHSAKLNRRIVAYRWKPANQEFASWYDADGREVPGRVRNSPIERYDQVTSLLRDRPDHQGIDFKAPVGVPVRSPFAGTVVRTNWNTRYNGNSIEVDHGDGTTALYLHLDRVDVKPGQRLDAGVQIGLSGNTGRSTGPHLHYQLMRGKEVIDPIERHGVDRRSLPVAELPAFRAFVEDMNARLGGDGA